MVKSFFFKKLSRLAPFSHRKIRALIIK